MISEKTMQSVLDVTEAVCLLSNYYREKGISNRSTSAYITGGFYPALRLLIGKFTEDNGTFVVSESLEVLLDDEHKFGNTFAEVAAAIKREMERVENG